MLAGTCGKSGPGVWLGSATEGRIFLQIAATIASFQTFQRTWSGSTKTRGTGNHRLSMTRDCLHSLFLVTLKFAPLSPRGKGKCKLSAWNRPKTCLLTDRTNRCRSWNQRFFLIFLSFSSGKYVPTHASVVRTLLLGNELSYKKHHVCQRRQAVSYSGSAGTLACAALAAARCQHLASV